MSKESSNNIKLQVAMKAVVVNRDGKILLLREAATYKDGTNVGKYHLPGGRIEPGEHFEEALKREVKEESGLAVKIKAPIYVGEWRPVIRGVTHQIVATFFVCEVSGSDKVVLSDEHDKAEWVSPKDALGFNILDPENKVIDAFINYSNIR